MERRSIGKQASLPATKVLELIDLKAYGTFFVGWRLKYGTERNDTELFYISLIYVSLNARGDASLSGHELAETSLIAAGIIRVY